MDPRGDQGRSHLNGAPLSVVVPVYNEGKNIEGVLRRFMTAVATRPVEILVVYDFDGDTTVPVVQRLQPEIPEVRLVRNTLGRGVLNAIRTGFAAAAGGQVLVMMADGSDEPGDVDAMVDKARGGADLVSAARYAPGGHQVGGPLLKRLMSRTAGLSLHWVAGVPTHDPTNNFKLYSRGLLDAVQIESSAGFELALELTVKAHALGFHIAEVPTTWRDRTAGESRFRLTKWLPHYLRWYGYGMRARLRRR
jgi:glycosyltransferase involved in cell wall biosynthesis